MNKTLLIVSCGAATVVAGLGLSAVPPTPARPPAHAAEAKMRLGTYDSRGIALAYGRSSRPDCMLAKVEQIREQHETAKAAGNGARMKELEAQAVAIQDEIHKQVFSGASIDGILPLIEADLTKVAQTARVSVIVGEVLFHDPTVEIVDVTLEMCAPFEPDAATLKMIKDLLKKPVVSEYQFSTEH